MVSRMCSARVVGAPEDCAFPAAPASSPYWSSHTEGQGLRFTTCQGYGHREEEKEGRENAIALMGTDPGVPVKLGGIWSYEEMFGPFQRREREVPLKQKWAVFPLSALLSSQVDYGHISGHLWSGFGFQGPQAYARALQYGKR